MIKSGQLLVISSVMCQLMSNIVSKTVQIKHVVFYYHVFDINEPTKGEPLVLLLFCLDLTLLR